MLGDTLEQIAGEKAGIIKPDMQVVTGAQDATVLAVLEAHAAAVGATLHIRDRDWRIEQKKNGFRYSDSLGSLCLPPPALLGLHQYDNAGIAIATMRAAGLALPDMAFAQGVANAVWPARLQRLTGRLAELLPLDWELWLDGGHNPGAGKILAEHIASWADQPVHLIVGMKQSKDSAEFLRPLLPYADTIWAVSEPGQHLALPIEAIVKASGGVARPGPTVRNALLALSEGMAGRVLICGSLYLAGEVLKADAEAANSRAI